jgi:hypothetical protein
MNDGNSDSSSLESHLELSQLDHIPLPNSGSTGTGSHQKEFVATIHRHHQLLESFFKGWHLAIQNSHKEHLLNLRITQIVSRHRLQTVFTLWSHKSALLSRLTTLGHKIRATKHLQQWNAVVRIKFEERKRFLKALLVRRQIYEQRYFVQWQNSLRLLRRYHFVARSADASLASLALKGLKICVQHAHHQRSLEEQVVQSRLFCSMKTGWRQWRLRLHFRLLLNLVDRNHTELLIRRSFAHWQGRLHQIEVRRRKIIACEISTRRCLMRSLFNRWYSKFSARDVQKNRTKHLIWRINHRIIGFYFTEWMTKFNKREYLSGYEKDLTKEFRITVIRRCFSQWHSSFRIITQKRLKTDSYEAEILHRQLARWFLRWKSRHTTQIYDITMLKKAHRRLGHRTLERLWSK